MPKSKGRPGAGRPQLPAGAGGGGQPNMQALMRQAQKMQTDMAAAQEQLAAAQVEGTAANGLVTATVSGGGELLALSVKPEVVDPEDVDTLVDLVLYAVQDAQTKAGQLTEQTMAPLSAGLGGMGGMPGLPF
jgi:DNA-binding YbaB/EbfC family protein